MQPPKVKVLVVDDSLVFRELIRRGIMSDPLIEVIATAQDPFEARDKILQFSPDVMTCDVEMPKMNGIEFIRQLLPQYAIPTIVVSAVNEAVFDAMSVGAVDFVVKPDASSVKQVEGFIHTLIAKIKMVARANVNSFAGTKSQKITGPGEEEHRTVGQESDKLIVIGSSTGGTEATQQLLQLLPAQMPGIIIVQHIPPVFSRMYAERLNATTPFYVKEAEHGDMVEPGKVLVAPGDKHVRIKKVGSRFKVECFDGEKVNGHCPSVDVLFESVAKEAGPRAIGIILTGMGYDGARGLLAMKRKGARTIGQDEKSSIVYGMPRVAFEVGAVEKQASLSEIPRVLLRLI